MCIRDRRGDDDFTAPDSYVRILVSDEEFLNENNIADGAELMDDKYGLITYALGKIPVSEVTILRRSFHKTIIQSLLRCFGCIPHFPIFQQMQIIRQHPETCLLYTSRCV